MAVNADRAESAARNEETGWDAYYRSLSDEQAAWSEEPDPLVAELIARVGSDPAGIVLDLGCGDGRNLLPWSATHWQSIGMDISPRALRLIAQRVRGSQNRPPMLIQGSMADLRCFIDGYVDIVQCFDALPQVANVGEALREIQRVLRPGGTAVVNVFTPDDCAFGEGEQLAARTFRYKDTLFQFFVEDELEAMLPESIQIVERRRREWIDPPHIPFRPYQHTHVALYYTLVRV